MLTMPSANYNSHLPLPPCDGLPQMHLQKLCFHPFSSLMRTNSSFNLVLKTHCIHPLSFYLQSDITIDELNSPSTTQTHRQRHLFIRESLDLQHHEDPANVHEMNRRVKKPSFPTRLSEFKSLHCPLLAG